MNEIARAGVVAVAVAAGLTISGVATPSAQAATWHQGIPKILRGKWVDGKKNQLLNYYPTFVGKANELSFSGIDPTINQHMHYRHKKGSSIYYVKGHETMYSHGKLVNYYKFSLHKTTRKHKKYQTKFYIYYQNNDGQIWRAKKAHYSHYFYK